MPEQYWDTDNDTVPPSMVLAIDIDLKHLKQRRKQKWIKSPSAIIAPYCQIMVLKFPFLPSDNIHPLSWLLENYSCVCKVQMSYLQKEISQLLDIDFAFLTVFS